MKGKISYIDIKQSAYWMSEVTGFRFASPISSLDTSNEKTYDTFEITSGVTNAFTDTGTTCLNGPHDEMSIIIAKIVD